jgi:hypothetical protein
MPKFFRGVVPAWLSRRPPARRGTANPAPTAKSAIARAAALTIESLEERRLCAATLLTNGTGDATLRITVDAYGSYGFQAGPPANDARYDPVGLGGDNQTTYQSATWFSPIDNWLSQGSLDTAPNQGVLPDVAFTTTTASSAVSNFTLGGYAIQLTQNVNPVDDEGTTFVQQYRVTNNSGTAQPIRFVRHVDGDMLFQPGINDFAGVSADGSFVFEFDTATDPTQSSGFFGITSQGGSITGYAIHGYQGGYFDAIDGANGIPGADLNQIQNATGTDTDADDNRLTDTGYDVTVSLQTDFPTLPQGATILYTSITRFGQGAPADIIGTPRVQFSSSSFQRVENGRFAAITLTREGSTLGAATVDVDVIPGGTATDGVDFTDPTNAGAGSVLTVTFAPGQARTAFLIPIIDDDILDGDETVLLRLSNPSAGTDLGTPIDATLTIIDDTPFIRLSAAAFSFPENVGTARITVERTGSTLGEATVDYQLLANGTATAGADFSLSSGTLTFLNGQSEITVDVPVTLDFLLEGDETFGIVLSNPTNAGLGTPVVGTVTIVNFETPPTVIDVDTIGFNNRINQIVLTFSRDLDESRAELHTNYDLYLRKEKPLGGAVSRQKVRINNATFEYDVNADTVTITPVKGLKYNRFYEINVSGTRTNAVGATGGTPLDGNADATPGDDYRNYFGRGNRLSYYDREGDRVDLQTLNGSVLDVDRPVAREEARVEMQDVFPLETILTGTFTPVKRGITNNQSTIIVLNSFGVARQLPPQLIVETPDLP